MSRGFRKKFATFFLISDTRPLLSLVTRPIALSLPSPRLELHRPLWWLLAIVSPLSFSPLRACFHCSWWLSLSRFPLLTFFVRYCIAHNPLLLQPLGHWFTFIYRKHEHLAVRSKCLGTRGKSYIALVGFPLRVASLNFCIYYSTLDTIRQEVF